MRSQAKTLRRLPNSPPRSSRLAWRQGPQGSKQHLALAAPPKRTRTQRPKKYLAIHAAELAVEPNFKILRRHRRSLLLRLEHAHRSAVENHVHRPPRLGSRRSLNLRIGVSAPFCQGLTARKLGLGGRYSTASQGLPCRCADDLAGCEARSSPAAGRPGGV